MSKSNKSKGKDAKTSHRNGKKVEMNDVQRATFTRYYAMGAERSLEKIAENVDLKTNQDGTAVAPKSEPVPLDTLKKWSIGFGWQALIEKLDEEANQKVYSDAVNGMRATRLDIMKLFRAQVLRYASQIRNNPNHVITTADIMNFWRITRVESGQPTEPGGSGASPSVNVHANPDGSFDFSASLKKYEDPEDDK